MAWEIIKRSDYFEGSNRPFVSISPGHIAFNAMFVKIASLDPGFRVTVYADPALFRLGFEFHRDERPNSLALSQASSHKKGEKGGADTIPITKLIEIIRVLKKEAKRIKAE